MKQSRRQFVRTATGLLVPTGMLGFAGIIRAGTAPSLNVAGTVRVGTLTSQGAGGGAFEPDDISGLKYWLKGGDGVYEDAGTDPCEAGDGIYQWNDMSGNANHAQQTDLNARPVWQTTYANYDPSVLAKWVEAPDHSTLDFTGSISIVAKAYFDVVTGNQTIVVKGRNTLDSETNYCLRTNADEINFYYYDGSGFHVWETTAANLSATTNYTIIFSYTFGSGGTAACYINSSSYGGSWTSGTGNASVSANTQKLSVGVIGCDSGGSEAQLLDGRLFGVCIYDSVLTSQNRTDLFSYFA